DDDDGGCDAGRRGGPVPGAALGDVGPAGDRHAGRLRGGRQHAGRRHAGGRAGSRLARRGVPARRAPRGPRGAAVRRRRRGPGAARCGRGRGARGAARDAGFRDPPRARAAGCASAGPAHAARRACPGAGAGRGGPVEAAMERVLPHPARGAPARAGRRHGGRGGVQLPELPARHGHRRERARPAGRRRAGRGVGDDRGGPRAGRGPGRGAAPGAGRRRGGGARRGVTVRALASATRPGRMARDRADRPRVRDDRVMTREADEGEPVAEDVTAVDERGAEILAFWELARPSAGMARVGVVTGTTVAETVPPPAWSFGDNPALADDLLEAVLTGEKTATSSALWEYEDSGEQVPRVGELSILLDGQ